MGQSVDGIIEWRNVDIRGPIRRERLSSMKRKGWKLADEVSLGDGRTRYRFKRAEVERR
jgi:hypothetical protein